jgi:hypothetical protein
VADALGTYNWRAIDAMETPRWWILAVVATSTLDSTLAIGLRTLDIIDAMGTSS